MTTPMTQGRATELARQYQEGKSVDTLIAEFDTSYFTVKKVLKENSVAIRPKNATIKSVRMQEHMKSTKWDDAMLEKAKRAYESGSLKDAARVTGFSATYVNTMLRQSGVTLREPHKTLGRQSAQGNTTSITAEKKFSFGKFQSMSLR